MGSPCMLGDIAGKRSDDGHVWIGGSAARMNPGGTHVSIIGHNFRNSYEQTVNSFGDVFQSDNDAPPASRVTPLMEGGNAGFASDQGKLMLTALAFTPTRAAAEAMLEIAADPQSGSRALALWWLLNRKGNDWSAFDLDAGMKKRGIYDPDKVELVAVEMPPLPVNAPPFPPAAEVARLQGDPARGAADMALCYNCHRIGESGVEFGPNLSTFGRQQTTEAIVEAVVNPSAAISHGFEGTGVITKDGLTITGVALSPGDPVILKCMGGTVQTVPRPRIRSIKPLGRSLMYDSSLLGLTPQAIADITAYLKSL